MQTNEHSNIHINNMIIKERNQEMEKVSQDVQDIQEIYTDLALLVQEQGMHINTIADNIEQCASYTESSVIQLQKAEKRQKKWCILC